MTLRLYIQRQLPGWQETSIGMVRKTLQDTDEYNSAEALADMTKETLSID